MLPDSAKRAALLVAYAIVVSSQTYASELEEILVTAQKRAQSLQDVPVAVTAIGTQALENLNLTDASGLTQATSSLTFEDGAGDGALAGTFRIRGIGTALFDSGTEPAVAVLIDGVSLVNTSLALSALSDLQQVEILRGPQSTLYGKNASAGLINIVTKAPTEEFEAKLEAQLIEDEQKYTASVSGPINGGLSYRVSGFWHDMDPLGQNLATGNDVYSFTNEGAKAKLHWHSEDNGINATFSTHYAETEGDKTGSARLANYPLFAFAPPPFGLPLDDGGVMPSSSNRDIAQEFDPATHTRYYGASMSVNWELGDHELVSITAFDNYTLSWTRNLINFQPLPLLPFPPFFLDGDLNDQRDVETQLISQELRLVSPVGTRFDYVLGAYAAKSTVDEDLLRESQVFAALNFDRSADTSSETAALFGQFNYQLTDDLNLSIGTRFNYEKIGIDYEFRAPTPVVLKDDDSESKWLGKVALQYFLEDENETMLYASVATGYKGQTFDVSSVTPTNLDEPVKAETALAYELGLKTSLLDNRLQLNAALFHTDYDDYQAQTLVLQNGVLEAKVDNVGKLRTKGVELDAVALLSTNFRATTSVAFTEAEIREFDHADCYPGQTEPQGCFGGLFQDLAGQDLNNSPDWKVTAALDYDLPLEELPFDGFFQLNYVWQDDTQYSISGNPNTIQDGYDIVNLNIGIKGDEGAYRITFFVNNVFDKNYAAFLSDGSGLSPGQGLVLSHTLARNFERYMGAKVRFAF